MKGEDDADNTQRGRSSGKTKKQKEKKKKKKKKRHTQFHTNLFGEFCEDITDGFQVTLSSLPDQTIGPRLHSL